MYTADCGQSWCFAQTAATPAATPRLQRSSSQATDFGYAHPESTSCVLATSARPTASSETEVRESLASKSQMDIHKGPRSTSAESQEDLCIRSRTNPSLRLWRDANGARHPQLPGPQARHSVTRPSLHSGQFSSLCSALPGHLNKFIAEAKQ